MCAGKSSIQPAEPGESRISRQGKPEPQHRGGVFLHAGALYRVLRGGRQRPQRSVDRKSAGRNASEAIELRHLVQQSVGAEQVCSSEGNTRPMGMRPTGVQEHGMFSRLDWKPRRSKRGERVSVSPLDRESKLSRAGEILRSEVRSFHSSEEVG